MTVFARRRFLFAGATFILLTNACKQRDPEAAGLLSDGTQSLTLAEPSAEAPGAGGAFTITCHPVDAETAAKTYILDVRGAVSDSDETQSLTVSVTRKDDASSAPATIVAPLESGRGVVRLKGSIFIGFAAGVLTADVAPGSAVGTHTGLLTLSNDQGANGMAVACTATSPSPQGP